MHVNDAPDAGPDAAADSDLIVRARRGEQEAIHGLIDRYAQPLYVTAVYLTRNRADADDAVQETLLAMVQSIASFRGEASFKTWLWSILIRQTARLRRRRIGFSGHVDRPDAGMQDAADVRMDVHAALQRLPDDHREVLVLREFEHMSYEQMAQTLGVPRGTVESRLHRARAALRHWLAGYEAHQEDPCHA